MIFKNYSSNIVDNKKFDDFFAHYEKEKITPVEGLFGSSLSLFIINLLKKISKSIIILSRTDEEAENIVYDLETFGLERAFLFPSIDTTPYSLGAVEEEITSRRLDVIRQLIVSREPLVISTSIKALLMQVTPKERISEYFLNIKTGDLIDRDELAIQLVQSGYYRVEKVTDAGEFSIRGDIIDIYYSPFKNPVRLDFFDIELTSIRSFDPETQKREETIEEIIIPPYKEIVYNVKELSLAKDMIEKLQGDPIEKEALTSNVSNYSKFDGEYYYLNLFYEKKSLLDYFEEPTIIINDYYSINSGVGNLNNEFESYYTLTANHRKVKFKPDEILFTLDEIYTLSSKIVESNYIANPKNLPAANFDFRGLPIYTGDISIFKKDLSNYIDEKYKVIIFASNEAQKNRLSVIFSQFNPNDDRFDFKESGFSIFPLYLSNGFLSKEKKLIFITDYEILGKRKKLSSHFYSRRTEVIDSFIDLKPGDYVVHIQHGVGQFTGIERVKSMGVEKDYIAILYADNDKIFIPVEQLNFIQKYISSDVGSKPSLDRIGSKGWNRTKERVKKSIHELAEDLIKIYAYRMQEQGIQFLPDTPWQKQFEAIFPYEETEDQLLAIEEVKRDMERITPMDRLICGDVGFGKTEVAMRAAFKAVMSGKMCVVLVPTTILAEQHYENFIDRFKGYPITIEMLSRFRTREEQNKILESLKAGKIDIIIGTHRLVSKDIVLKNPGLLIIDEEHRFGVRHKEKIKQLKKNLDCLTMTATPIPRTLHFSLAKIRDMSIINTPPQGRIPIETYVTEFSEEILVDAAERELERNGQIFFVHNRVKTIYEMQTYLEKVLPNARIVVAHAQMDESELEDIIHSFINYKYDILLTTTIIESGINIPRANTIFIDRADKFGLAQLYQLRGRVGRAETKGYAYLFYSPNSVITEDAMKRLKVISEYTDLGSGFKIAMKDLEIRGAGNLLGIEQSGDIMAVGFHLYTKLLEEAVRELQKDDEDKILPEENEVYIELNYNGFISDTYISDIKQKIEFYKKIAGVSYREEIDEIKTNIEDRFGKIPKEVEALFYVAYIRIICKEMGIKEIIEKESKIELVFSNDKKIDFNKIMKEIKNSKGKIYLLGDKPNSIFLKIDDDELPLEKKWEYLKSFLERIAV